MATRTFVAVARADRGAMSVAATQIGQVGSDQ
jgi:hypothetical protein